ncbi:hypothetical protein LCGC14_2705120, partial [marine sediment metagenome]
MDTDKLSDISKKHYEVLCREVENPADILYVAQLLINATNHSAA